MIKIKKRKISKNIEFIAAGIFEGNCNKIFKWNKLLLSQVFPTSCLVCASLAAKVSRLVCQAVTTFCYFIRQSQLQLFVTVLDSHSHNFLLLCWKERLSQLVVTLLDSQTVINNLCYFIGQSDCHNILS